MVELLVFIFIIIVFIAFLLSRSYAPDGFTGNTVNNASGNFLDTYASSYTNDREYSDVPPKPTRKKKSVTFDDVVTERIFDDNGRVKSDKLVAING